MTQDLGIDTEDQERIKQETRAAMEGEDGKGGLKAERQRLADREKSLAADLRDAEGTVKEKTVLKETAAARLDSFRKTAPRKDAAIDRQESYGVTMAERDREDKRREREDEAFQDRMKERDRKAAEAALPAAESKLSGLTTSNEDAKKALEKLIQRKEEASGNESYYKWKAENGTSKSERSEASKLAAEAHAAVMRMSADSRATTEDIKVIAESLAEQRRVTQKLRVAAKADDADIYAP